MNVDHYTEILNRIRQHYDELGFFREHYEYYSLTLEGCQKEIPLNREKYNELLGELKERYSNLPR